MREANNVLRRLRLQHNLSGTALARKSGVPRPALYRFEEGERLLTADAAEKLAGPLGVDPVALLVRHNTAALKASIEAGGERPIRAASLAKTLIELLESGTLSPTQRRAARAAVGELVALVETVAEQRGSGTLAALAGHSGPVDPPSRDVEDSAGRSNFETDFSANYEEDMDSLGRDRHGRRKPRRGGDSVDPNLDYNLESGEYQARFSRRTPSRKSAPVEKTTYEELGRDSFGRKLP